MDGQPAVSETGKVLCAPYPALPYLVDIPLSPLTNYRINIARLSFDWVNRLSLLYDLL